MKRILVLNPWRGLIGPNVGMLQLGKALLHRGYGLEIVAPEVDEMHQELREDGANIHVAEFGKTPRTLNPLRLLGFVRANRANIRKLADKIRETHSDLLVLNSENMLTLPKSGRLAGVPSAVIIRGIRFAELGIFGRTYFCLQKRHVNRYMAVSETVRSCMTDAGVPEDMIAVTPNGVDTEKFSPGPSRGQVRRELGIPADAPLVGAICHLVPRKGNHHLVEAMIEVNRAMPEAHALLIGHLPHGADPEYEANLREMVRGERLADRVHFMGYRKDTPDLLKAVDLLAHPSETESFGRTIAEAMATGKAVVGFRHSAVAELIVHGKTGLLAEPFDHHEYAVHLMRLLQDVDLRDRMGHAGRERVLECYDLKVCIERLVGELEDLIL
ncbi:MAG: glycosyltransferase family 4 protein [Phycisphaerae bacterium]